MPRTRSGASPAGYRAAPQAARATRREQRQSEGPFATDHSPPGVLRLTFAMDTAWMVSMEMVMDRPIASDVVTDFKLDGGTLAWRHGLMGGTCGAVAVLDSGSLKGEATCDRGAYTFTLVKK